MSYKIIIPEKMKNILRTSEMLCVQQMQIQAKKDGFTLKDYGKKIADAMGENYLYSVKVFEPQAEIAKNMRVMDAFADGSGNLDVWISCYIFGETICGEFGAYITDLWNISSNNKDEIRTHILKRRMYKQIV
jgi:hypothetical protein